MTSTIKQILGEDISLVDWLSQYKTVADIKSILEPACKAMVQRMMATASRQQGREAMAKVTRMLHATIPELCQLQESVAAATFCYMAVQGYTNAPVWDEAYHYYISLYQSRGVTMLNRCHDQAEYDKNREIISYFVTEVGHEAEAGFMDMAANQITKHELN